jgi:phosphonate degradation associated HDIG domain protein
MNDTLIKPDEFIEQLSQLFAEHSDKDFIGNRLSNADHMLQAAAAASTAQADDHLIAASLLHDLGHWIHGGLEDATARGQDDRHEQVAADYLNPYFNEAVIAPIVMHVAAKRYLCAVKPEYFKALSPDSVRTLELQGGPMNEQEIAEFEATPGFEDAVTMRRWDEYGKVPGLEVPGFDAYRSILHGQMKS